MERQYLKHGISGGLGFLHCFVRMVLMACGSRAADHLGLNASEKATCFPTLSTVANSWDEKLARQIGRALGEEAAVQGVDILLGPGLNIKRSPLCGRNFEYFSEDPYLSGKMAAAYVRGRNICVP